MKFISKSPLMIFQPAAILVLLLSRNPNCYADTNDSSSSLCNPTTGSNQSSSWTANLNSVFSSLEANVNLNNGYYRAEAGKSPDKVYGLIQCRGDISPSDCSECSRKAVRQAIDSCGKSNGVLIMQQWCYLRYSNTSFYGVWEESHFSVSNSTDPDDPRVVLKGLAMMSRLAAVAPTETLMFAKSETDDGKGGKRYGLAQCTRDLERSDCGDCLDYLLDSTGTEITNKRSWESYAVGCFMLYDHHQFNSSTSVNRPRAAVANRAWTGRYSVGITMLTIAMAYLYI